MLKLILRLFGWRYVEHVVNGWDNYDLYMKNDHRRLYIDRSDDYD